MKSLPRARVYRPEIDRVIIGKYRVRPLGQAEIEEWYRDIERLRERRAGADIQRWRIG